MFWFFTYFFENVIYVYDMRMRMHMQIPKSSRKWFKSSNIDPKWGQNGVTMEPTWSQNGAKMEPKCSCGASWRASERASTFWCQNGTKVEPKWTQNGAQIWENVSKKRVQKHANFQTRFFNDVSMMLGLFLDRFFNIFLLFFNNSKKGRHAFRLRHGEWIEGLTYQFHVLRTYRRAAGGKGEAEVNARRGFMPTWRIMYKKHSLWRPRTPKRRPNA